MKLRSVLLGDLSNREVEQYLQQDKTILIPVGATEIHGAHAPLNTDWLISAEVCQRVAERQGWLVAPPLPYGLSGGWKGRAGLAYVMPTTLLAVVRDLCTSLAEAGFRHMAFVNGHLPNHRPLVMACLEASGVLPEGCMCYGVSYWDGLKPEQVEEFLSLRVGLHANVGETSVVMAIRPDLVDLAYAQTSWPEMPGVNPSAVFDAVFETRLGGSNGVCPEGVWGDPTQSSGEKGDQYLEQLVTGLERLLMEIARVGRDRAYIGDYAVKKE